MFNIAPFSVPRYLKQCRRILTINPGENRAFKRRTNKKARRAWKQALSRGDWEADFSAGVKGGYIS